MNKETTTNPTHNGLAINVNQQRGLSCFEEVINRHHAHLHDMTNKHSKVTQIRFDLRYPADGSVTPDSSQLSDFNYNLQRKLQRENNKGGHLADPRVITVTEQHGNSPHPHIHGIIIVNGNTHRKALPILQEVERQWQQALHTDVPGLVDHCNKKGKNGITINRNADDFQDKMHQCSHQASYLAKTRGKESKSKGSWLVTGTRTPKQNKE